MPAFRFALALAPWLLATTAAAQEFTARATADWPRPPIPAAGSEPPLALAPRANGGRVAAPSRPGASTASAGGLTSLLTMLGSLIVVLAVFLAATWVLRKTLPAGVPLLPREVVEVLGRTPLAGRQQAHLLRCGNKLVLVAITSGGAEPLVEVTDPVEVDRLSGLCRAAGPHSSTEAFRQIFQQFGRDKSPRGFFGRRAAQTELANAGAPTKGEDNDA